VTIPRIENFMQFTFLTGIINKLNLKIHCAESHVFYIQILKGMMLQHRFGSI
jgi:hypothetical protein